MKLGVLPTRKSCQKEISLLFHLLGIVVEI